MPMRHLFLLIPAPFIDLGLRQPRHSGHLHNLLFGPGPTLPPIKLMFEQFQLGIALPLSLPIFLRSVVPPAVFLTHLLLFNIPIFILVLIPIHLLLLLPLHLLLNRRRQRRLTQRTHKLGLRAEQLGEEVLLFLADVGREEELDLTPDFGG